MNKRPVSVAPMEQLWNRITAADLSCKRIAERSRSAGLNGLMLMIAYYDRTGRNLLLRRVLSLISCARLATPIPYRAHRAAFLPCSRRPSGYPSRETAGCLLNIGLRSRRTSEGVGLGSWLGSGKCRLERPRLSASQFPTPRNRSAAPLEVGIRARARGDPEIRIAVLDGPVEYLSPYFRGLSFTRVPASGSPAKYEKTNLPRADHKIGSERLANGGIHALTSTK